METYTVVLERLIFRNLWLKNLKELRVKIAQKCELSCLLTDTKYGQKCNISFYIQKAVGEQRLHILAQCSKHFNSLKTDLMVSGS